MTTAITLKSWFDSMLGDISYPKDSQSGELYPFFVRVGVIKRRPPRHEFFDFFKDIGLRDIIKTFDKTKIDNSYLAFVFPERHMGVAEQQAFTHSLCQNPGVSNIKQVDILTSSPLIVGSFMREQLRILTWPEDEGLYEGLNIK